MKNKSGSVNWGDLRCLEPISKKWGYDRGKPIDRFYIERFLEEKSELIRGTCVELLNDDYTYRFGEKAVTKSEILDINKENPKATIIADLTEPRSLKPEFFDCFLLTQTLQFIFDVPAVLRNVWQAIAPGGAVLITAPCLQKNFPDPDDYWRFTPSSLHKLMKENMAGAQLEVQAHGNILACVAFLYGISCEEMTQGELEYQDPDFPLCITAHGIKPK